MKKYLARGKIFFGLFRFFSSWGERGGLCFLRGKNWAFPGRIMLGAGFWRLFFGVTLVW
jgi:hypothetical protein